MKKLLIFSAILLLVGSFTSCNKKKIKDLEKEIEDLKSSQNQNQNQTNAHSNILLSGFPINVNFQGNRGYDSAGYNYSRTFEYMYDRPGKANYVYFNNSTYEFWIGRYSTVEESEWAEIYITNFDPAQDIEDAEIYVYAEGYF
jgi:hypothetical protein